MNKIKKNSRNTENAPQNELASQSVSFSHYTNISAQLPVNPKTGKIVDGGVKAQAKQCMDHLLEIVQSIDHVMDDVVKATIYLKNSSDIKVVEAVYQTYFKKELPTCTFVTVADLPMNALVQIDALISNGEGTTPQKALPNIKLSRSMPSAPESIHAHSVAFSHYNNLSAQLPINPKSGTIEAQDIKGQTTQCLNNIKSILEAMDHKLEDIVKTTVYLQNIEDISAVNEIFTNFFPNHKPAVTFVNATAPEKNALIQIDTVVSHGDGTPPQLAEDSRFLVIEANSTEKAPKLAYPQTVAYSHYNHISGQLPISPKTNELVAGDIKDQATQCLENIKAILESIDHDMDDIVKITIQLKNIEDLKSVDSIYPSYFENTYPVRTVIGVNEMPMNALLQMDAVVSNAEGTPA